MSNPQYGQNKLDDKLATIVTDGSVQGVAVTSPAAVTTVGDNTGTAAAGLSLIGDTSTVDGSAAIMADFASLQEDVSDIRNQLEALLSSLEGAELIAT